MTTFAPSATSIRALAPPMLRAPPLISTTLPSTRPMRGEDSIATRTRSRFKEIRMTIRVAQVAHRQRRQADPAPAHHRRPVRAGRGLYVDPGQGRQGRRRARRARRRHRHRRRRRPRRADRGRAGVRRLLRDGRHPPGRGDQRRPQAARGRHRRGRLGARHAAVPVGHDAAEGDRQGRGVRAGRRRDRLHHRRRPRASPATWCRSRWPAPASGSSRSSATSSPTTRRTTAPR